MKTKTEVDSVDGDGVVAGGERIASANVIWAAGTAATPVADWLGAEKGKGNGIRIGPDCAVLGHPDIFAVGDCTYSEDSKGQRLPGVATVAKQQGAYVAEVLKSRMVGLPPPPPFAYRDQGQLAMVGPFGRGRGPRDASR